jgi:hypothetical protein
MNEPSNLTAVDNRQEAEANLRRSRDRARVRHGLSVVQAEIRRMSVTRSLKRSDLAASARQARED